MRAFRSPLRRVLVGWAFVTCIASGATAFRAAGVATCLRITSEPGDFVGQGHSYDFTESDGVFEVATYGGPTIVRVRFYTPDFSHFWSLEFVAPGGGPLGVGFQDHATSYWSYFPDQAGIEIGGDGRGSGSTEGTFEVKQIEFDANWNVKSLWIVFLQRADGAVAALTGEVRYHADVRVAIHAPMRWSVKRGGVTTLDVQAAEVSDGPAELAVRSLPTGSTFTDHGDNTGTLVWVPTPDTAIGPRTLAFEATNRAGATDVQSMVAEVLGRNELDAKSDYWDPVGGGKTYQFGDGDGEFYGSTSMNEVAISFWPTGASCEWELQFWPPYDRALEAGTYPYAELYPPQTPGAAGLNVRSCTGSCYAVKGSFVVKQITFRRDGTLMSFWATFEQHCGDLRDALRGEVMFNADVPRLERPKAGRWNRPKREERSPGWNR